MIPENSIKKKHKCRQCGIELTKSNIAPSRVRLYDYVCTKCRTKYVQQLRKKNPDKRRNYELLSRHGISLDEYNKLLNTQLNKCAICRRPASMFKDSLHVDHNHKTGIIRGLICYGCNRYLGQIKDDVSILKKAISYLENNNGDTS